MRLAVSGDESVWKWGCTKCGRGDDDDKREQRNCDDETNQNIAWAWAPNLRRCPWSQIDDLALAVVEAWVTWEQYGTTPWGPDPMQGPVWFFEALQLCDSIKADVTAQRDRQAQREAERARRRG